MKVGFVVAMESEYAPFLGRLGKVVSEVRLSGVNFCVYELEGRTVVLAQCGIGEIASSVATGVLIAHFCCDYIVNFGLVGSLGGSSVCSVVAVKDVVHYDSDLTAFGHAVGAPADFSEAYFAADQKRLSLLVSDGLPALRLASGDKFIADSFLKNKLKADFSADICDMEGAGVALTCARAGVPFTMIKVVSDDAGEGAVSSFESAKLSGFSVAVDIVLSVIKES